MIGQWFYKPDSTGFALWQTIESGPYYVGRVLTEASANYICEKLNMIETNNPDILVLTPANELADLKRDLERCMNNLATAEAEIDRLNGHAPGLPDGSIYAKWLDNILQRCRDTGDYSIDLKDAHAITEASEFIKSEQSGYHRGYCDGVADQQGYTSQLPAPQTRIDRADYKLGWWLLAVLEDPNLCEENKSLIKEWFEAHQRGFDLFVTSNDVAPSPPDPFDLCAMIVEEECWLDVPESAYHRAIGHSIRNRIRCAQRDRQSVTSTTCQCPTGIEAAKIVADYIDLRGEFLDKGDAGNIIHILHEHGIQFARPSVTSPERTPGQSREAREKEITRLATIEECAHELETSYPDHAWLNAACAAIRGLAVTSADGGAK